MKSRNADGLNKTGCAIKNSYLSTGEVRSPRVLSVANMSGTALVSNEDQPPKLMMEEESKNPVMLKINVVMQDSVNS